ncbi:MAG: MarR family transcriptional regulator [Ruminococcus flavefaciens]|nr:MarR family transcriptional regulator [Ruminococcus flavefaciens]
MDYQLEVKQIVDYPRCRIYREFLRSLMEDRDIRTNGSSYLFYYMTLCSYANFRSSYRRIEGISYLVGPGEWICKTSELAEWFRTRFQHQALSILDFLQKQNYITYTQLGRNNLVKFSIIGWKQHNTALDYNYPCLKDVGFFFFPVAAVHELISMGKCSEMDIVLDLWIHAIYNDGQVQGSELGPVVYFRNCTGNPLISFSDLALRWGISKSTVCRILNKLQDKDYLSLVSFTGRHGSIIYLCSYLSTMFNISDVMIDKEEISMAFQIPVHIPGDSSLTETEPIRDEQITIMETDSSVSSQDACVSKPHMKKVIQKVAQILAAQGVSCCECPRTQYKLYPLSDCKETIVKYSLQITCPDGKMPYRFELTLSPVSPPEGSPAPISADQTNTKNEERR